MKKIYYTLLCAVAFTATSCGNFLDVQPKGTLKNDVMFSDIQGYRDAMYGIYASMASPKLYGQNLGYGFTDKIGQLLNVEDNQSDEYRIGKYEYYHQAVRPTIDVIWGSQYAVISYVNNVLEQALTSDLKHNELELIKGEAYALRAFLHFDLLRLFSEDYRVGATTRGIPYAYDFSLQNKEVFTVEGTVKNILADLATAEKYLVNDEVTFADTNLSSAYLDSRYAHFNKWAVKALQARVYHYMGDYANAAKYAQEVINANTIYKLTTPERFEAIKTFPSNGEMIFGLFTTPTFSQETANYFLTLMSGENQTNSTARKQLEELYDVANFSADHLDRRYSVYFRKDEATLKTLFVRFAATVEEATALTTRLKGLTLMRLSEMYLILAEALYDSNQEGAIAALNAVRNSRGLKNISQETTVNRTAFEQELLQERIREFMGEGQVFYAYKHYNRSFKGFDGVEDITPSKEIFVLPRPENENLFGNK